jgi:malate dehydrogenase
MKNSSAFFSPAVSAIEMLESYLNNQKKILPCSAYLSGEYNIKDLCVGVPVCIGSNGVEKIIELNLKQNEQIQFKQSVKAVDELIKKCKKLLV